MESHPTPTNPRVPRRSLFLGLGATALLSGVGKSFAEDLHTTKGAFAEEIIRTSWVEEGPFYPYRRLPLDTDNDLLIVNDDITPAVGEITHLGGRLLDVKGQPIRNARIEIWQVDADATYLAERGMPGREFDPNFQGFGRFITGTTGDYYFRTIKPIPYHGRPAPHIHFKIYVRGIPPFTTQLFTKGHPGNQTDGIYNSIGAAAQKATVTREYIPLKSSRIGELTANFDIILGVTQSA